MYIFILSFRQLVCNTERRKMKRTAIYIRVSSDRQSQEGDSIAAQRQALTKYIDNRPDLVLAGEYIDDGISGTKYSQRDELQRMLADVEEGKIDLLIFTRLDRFFRSVRHYTAAQAILDKHGVGWTAIWEPIYDTTTPQGRLIVNQMMSIAQFEAENTGQRIKQVQAYKVTQGEVISGNPPNGYRIENKHLVPSKDAESVLLAFQTFERTGSINGSLRELAGVPGLPRIQKDFKKMLKNPVYIGKYRDNDHFCEPIIPLPLWERVQELLPINIRSNQRQTYIFSGLIRCAECGCSFAANTRRRQRGNCLQIIHQYRCPKHYMRKPSLCTNPKVLNENVLERYMIENLSSMIEKTVVEYEATAKPARDKAARIAKLQKKGDKLKELFINDLISLEEYKADKEKLTAQIEALQAEAAEEPTVNTEALKQLQGMNFRGIYEGMEPDEKRRFWRAIIKTIRFDQERNIEVEFL